MPSFADRLYHAKWGVFNHFLFDPPGGSTLTNRLSDLSWDQRVSLVDTDKIAKSLHEMGAGYYFITVMQGQPYLAAPSAAFDAIAGTQPGQSCPHRDLILDLYESLSRYGIDLYLYFTGDGPYKDEQIGKKFGLTEPREGNVTESFVRKWASVLAEYTARYRGKVRGWWIDGCYEWMGYTQELLGIYYDAVKAADPDCGLAFNNGVFQELTKYYEKEDFVCGEIDHLNLLPRGRWVDGAQAHILTFAGNGWGSPGCPYTREQCADYVRRVHAAGGVVSFDVLIYPDGSFDADQQRVLSLRGLV